MWLAARLTVNRVSGVSKAFKYLFVGFIPLFWYVRTQMIQAWQSKNGTKQQRCTWRDSSSNVDQMVSNPRVRHALGFNLHDLVMCIFHMFHCDYTCYWVVLTFRYSGVRAEINSDIFNTLIWWMEAYLNNQTSQRFDRHPEGHLSSSMPASIIA